MRYPHVDRDSEEQWQHRGLVIQNQQKRLQELHDGQRGLKHHTHTWTHGHTDTRTHKGIYMLLSHKMDAIAQSPQTMNITPYMSTDPKKK